MAKSTDRTDVTNWVGWVYFAGLVMVLMGVFQSIAGFVALFTDTVYVLGEENLWVLDYTTWGWAHVSFGVFLFFAGFAVMAGRMWGRVVGIILTLLAAIANFAFVPVYPFWAILLLVVNFLVLYALVVHGKEAATELK